MTAGTAASRGGSRGRRRVVALSARDRDRVARGGVPEDVVRADRAGDALRRPPSWRLAAEGGQTGGEAGGEGWEANDERLARDVPPHW